MEKEGKSGSKKGRNNNKEVKMEVNSLRSWKLCATRRTNSGAAFLSPDNGGTEGGAKTIEGERNLFQFCRVVTA